MEKKDWDSHKVVMKDLFLTQNKSLQGVIDHMKETHGFNRSKAQYERQFKRWGFRKNTKETEWIGILHAVKKRKRVGKDSDVYVDGVLIDPKRIRKETSRRDLPTIRNQSEAPSPRTGEDVYINTPQNLSTTSHLLFQLPWLEFLGFIQSKVDPYPDLATTASKLAISCRTTIPTLLPSNIESSEKTTPKFLLSCLGLYFDVANSASKTSKTQQVKQIYHHLRAVLPERVELPPTMAGDTRSLIKLDGSAPYLNLVMYLVSNNMLNRDTMRGITEYLEGQENEEFFDSILSVKKPTIQAFAENLFQAAKKTMSLRIIKATLKAGAAAERGYIEMVQLLLSAGADVNAPAAEVAGRTALQVAAERGYIEMVQLLLSAGANVNIYITHCEATVEGHLKIIRLLLNAGADVNTLGAFRGAICSGHFEVVRLLLNSGANVNTLDYFEDTALNIAVSNGQLEITRLLLQAGADPNILGLKGWTPLQSVAHRLSPIYFKRDDVANSHDFEIVQLLLSAGADVDAPPVNHHGRTALQGAAQRGHFEMVQLLLQAGADANIPAAAEYGITALQGAAIGGYIGITLKLLEAGADVNAPKSECCGRTALEGAAEHGRIDMVQLLLNAGAHPGGPGTEGYKEVLEHAMDGGHMAVCNLIRERFEES